MGRPPKKQPLTAPTSRRRPLRRIPSGRPALIIGGYTGLLESFCFQRVDGSGVKTNLTIFHRAQPRRDRGLATLELAHARQSHRRPRRGPPLAARREDHREKRLKTPAALAGKRRRFPAGWTLTNHSFAASIRSASRIRNSTPHHP
jgi:hypothetical protein